MKTLFPKNRPLRWVLPAAFLLVAIFLQWQVPGWLAKPEAWTVDARFELRGAEQTGQPVMIVALDEASFQVLGDLNGENIRTWPRARWAEMVNKLAVGRPRLIVLDVVFDTPGWDTGGDQALAEAIRAARANGTGVVLAANLAQAVGSSAGVATAGLTYSPPVDVLAAAASASGVANLPVDADDAVRRTTLLYPFADATLPSLGLAAATLYRGQAVNVPAADLGKDLSLPIHFRGPEATFRTVPLHQVWLDEAAPETLEGAIVVVGYTTEIEQDRHPAPFGGIRSLPGAEIQANIIDTLLSENWLHRPPAWLPVALVAAAGLVGFTLASLPSPGLGTLSLGGSLLLYLGLGAWLFNRQGYLLPLTAPLVTAALLGAATITERAIFAERDKRLLRQRFSGLMSPERLQALLDNWENLLNTERPEKDAAVLFADIRGFTHTTELLMKENRSSEMVRFLNAYLDSMAQAVFVEGGVIYRTFGDGLLILFGLPEPLDDHHRKAVRAAMRMAEASRSLQPLWPLRDENPFQMGIGLNSGPMVDAIVGRGRRYDYTVLGDAVNAAARIESHCKVAMEISRPEGNWPVPPEVTVLVGSDLYQRVKDNILADKNIPPFEARGKAEALRVVRMLGLKEMFR
ncbi:MAG TPA: adenylate/guanylate cyclase domain-containing protein [Anaerolineales bacterium]|nr:adenylate/guanylate cyclase domain-containing protein [Anaerolineales bacterium]